MWKAIILAAVICAAIILVIAGIYLYLIMPGMWRRKQMRQFQGISWAHRGLHCIQRGIPENSMTAFREAVKEGVGIELDVHLTKDRKLIVFHDDTLERVCGKPGKIEDMTYDELKTCYLLGTAERMPLLSEVLDYVNGRVPLLIEVKLPTADTAICQYLAGQLDIYRGRVLVQSFNSLVLRWLKKYKKEILRGQLSSDLVKSDRTPHVLLRFCVKYLLTNCFCRPDFISYKMADSGNLSLWLNQYLFGVPVAVWTLKGAMEQKRARRRFQMYIFERNSKE